MAHCLAEHLIESLYMARCPFLEMGAGGGGMSREGTWKSKKGLRGRGLRNLARKILPHLQPASALSSQMLVSSGLRGNVLFSICRNTEPSQTKGMVR